MKTAVKPVAQMNDDEHADETLVTDHGIDGLVLHCDYDGSTIIYNGTIQIGNRPCAFEVTWKAGELINDKVDVRAMLIAGAIMTDNNEPAPGYIAMNRSFKALILKIIADAKEMNAQA